MATSDILGLFMSPEQYQTQQMAQQQAAEQQRAFNFAQLSPRDQAVYGMFLGGQQLARGLGGLLGVQDPQLQRIRQRQEIMQSINPADMESLMAGIQLASERGDQELALTLTDFMNKQGSEMALAQQRQAQARREQVQSLPAGVQEAELIGKLTEDLQKTTDPNQRAIIQAKIKRLEKNLTKADELEDLFAAEKEAIAEAQSRAAPSQVTGLNGLPLATQPTVNVDNDPRVKAIRARINTLTATPIDKQLPEVAKATALADLVSADRKSPEWQAEYATQLRRLTADRETAEKRSPEAQLLIDAGFIPGSPAFISELDKLRLGGGKADDATRLEGYFNELATIKTKYGDDVKGFDNDSRVKALQTLINKISGAKVGGKQPDAIEIADSIAGLKKEIRDAKDSNAPEILQAKDKLAVLEQQLKKDKPNLTVVGEVRSGPDKGKTVYVDENRDQQFVYSKNAKGEQVRKLVSDVDVDRMTSQVTASASSSAAPGVKAFREKLGGLDAKDVESARANRDNAIAALNTLNELTRLDQQGVISGAFAEGRKGAVNLLNTLGLVSNKDAGALANSQTFDKVAGDLILATLGGKLGAGFSNEDRKFIAGLVPQLETSRKARQQLITFMVKKNQLIIDEAIRLEDYARENDGLKGFKPKIPIVNAPAPGTVRAMTDDELKAAIEKARKGK